MKIGIANDHGGYELKYEIMNKLESIGYTIVNYGSNTSDRVDYPEYAFKLCQGVISKEIDLGSYGKHTLRIANKSTPSECSNTNFSQSACGFVLEFADIIIDHKMNDTNTNVGGWPATSMRTFVNNDIYNAIPSEIKNAIIDTTVVSGHGNTSGETNFTSTDKLYLLSTAEVWAQGSSNTIGEDTARDVTRQLDYYKNLGTSTSNYSGAIKKNGTSVDDWWLRAARSNNTDIFLIVVYNGDWSNDNASFTNGVAPAFRLG